MRWPEACRYIALSTVVNLYKSSGKNDQQRKKGRERICFIVIIYLLFFNYSIFFKWGTDNYYRIKNPVKWKYLEVDWITTDSFNGFHDDLFVLFIYFPRNMDDSQQLEVANFSAEHNNPAKMSEATLWTVLNSPQRTRICLNVKKSFIRASKTSNHQT